MEALNTEAVQLCENHPTSSETIQEKAGDLTENWAQLREKSSARKSKLNDSHIFQKFLSDYRYLYLLAINLDSSLLISL